MPKGAAESLGWLLLPLPDTPVVDDHIVLVADPADGDVAEREVLDPHSLLHSDHYTRADCAILDSRAGQTAAARRVERRERQDWPPVEINGIRVPV